MELVDEAEIVAGAGADQRHSKRRRKLGALQAKLAEIAAVGRELALLRRVPADAELALDVTLVGGDFFKKSRVIGKDDWDSMRAAQLCNGTGPQRCECEQRLELRLDVASETMFFR